MCNEEMATTEDSSERSHQRNVMRPSKGRDTGYEGKFPGYEVETCLA
jgi:hypothetical protein